MGDGVAAAFAEGDSEGASTLRAEAKPVAGGWEIGEVPGRFGRLLNRGGTGPVEVTEFLLNRFPFIFFLVNGTSSALIHVYSTILFLVHPPS